MRRSCYPRGVYASALALACDQRANKSYTCSRLDRRGQARARPQCVQGDATGRMRRDDNWRKTHSPWADKGSKRHLWNERSLSLAIDYVINGQGDDLPNLD